MSITTNLILGAKVAGAVAGLDKVKKKSRELTKREKLLGGAFLATAAATAYAMKQAINYGDYLEKTAQKTGVGTEALSAYKIGAELAGTSQEGLISGLQRLQKNMGAALRSKTSAAAIAFKNLGVEFQNADGSFRDMEEMLPEIADKMSKMADGTMKTQIAMDLMGRQGAELIPFLNQGADSLEAMREESEALGIVWSEEDATAAAEFNDALTRLGATFDGFVQRATKFYLPTLVSIAEGAVLAARAILKLDLEEKRRAKGLDDSRDVLNDYVEKTDAYVRILESTADAEQKMASRVWTDSLTRDMQIVVAAATELGFFKDATGELAEARDQLGTQILSKQLQAETGYSVEWRKEHEKAIRTLFREAQAREGIEDTIAIRKQRFKEIRKEMAGEAGLMVATGAEMQRILRDRKIEEERALGATQDAKDADKEREKGLKTLTGALDATAASTQGLTNTIQLLGKEGEVAIAIRAQQEIAALEAAILGYETLAVDEASREVFAQLREDIYAQIDLIEEQRDREIEIFREKEAEKTRISKEEQDKQTAYAIQAEADKIHAYQAGLQATADMAGMLSQLITTFHDEGNKEAKAAIKALFVVQQAAGLATAIVQMAVAIAQANASAPYPYNIPSIVAASVTGGASIATIVGTTIAGLADAGLHGDQLRAAGLNQHSLVAMRNDEVIVDPTGTAELTKMLQAHRAGMTAGGSPVVVNSTLEIDGEVLGYAVDSHLVRSSERALPYSDRIRYGVK